MKIINDIKRMLLNISIRKEELLLELKRIEAEEKQLLSILEDNLNYSLADKIGNIF